MEGTPNLTIEEMAAHYHGQAHPTTRIQGRCMATSRLKWRANSGFHYPNLRSADSAMVRAFIFIDEDAN